MAGVENIVTTILDQRRGPGLLRNPRTAESPGFALIGNTLGFGGGLFPNSGLLENRNDFEWEMGCISWQTPPEGEPRKAIKFRCNPSDVSWSMAQRSQEQKTKAGTVLHVWNDRDRKTYFDEPVITLNLQSGNILPVRSIAEPLVPSVPDGLNNFYEFLALVDEVKVLDDGRANLVYIDYNSLIFPRIRLWGFFTPNGISFSDKASDPAQVSEWTASFTVYKSWPSLGRGVATRNQAITSGSRAGLDLQAAFRKAGFPYRNRRSETFGLVQDAATTGRAVISGQIPPRDVPAASRAAISAATQRIVTRTATAAAGAASIIF